MALSGTKRSRTGRRVGVVLGAVTAAGACGGKASLPDDQFAGGDGDGDDTMIGSTTQDDEHDDGDGPGPDDSGTGGGAMGFGGSPDNALGGGPGSTDPRACDEVCDEDEECVAYIDDTQCLSVCDVGTTFVLSTQNEVYELAARDCRILRGTLNITGEEITNLASLDSVRLVDGTVYLSGITQLSASEGLTGLEVILRSLIITASADLVDLSLFSSLWYVGQDLQVTGNERLENVRGLDGVRFGDGQLIIASNPSLQSLGGLDGMLTRNATSITNNAALEDIDGLSSLYDVDQTLVIASNPGLRTTHLSALEHIDGSFTFTGHDSVTEFSAPKLRVVTESAVIAGNPTLLTVNLEALEEVGSLIIADNQSLSSIGRLSALTSVEENMVVSGNTNLPQCEVDVIDARIHACAPCEQNDETAVCD